MTRVHREKIMMWFAWHLPKWLVYWATIRAVVYSTTGKYSGQVVPELTAMDAIKRYGDDNYSY